MSQELAKETQMIKEAAAFIRQALPPAEVAIVLGSGLGPLADALEDPVVIDYTDIPHFPPPTVAGHSGKLLQGRLNGRQVYAFSGRYHYYEGNEPHTVILPLRVLHELGVDKLILTNASGGVNSAFHPGDIMLICDHINLTGYNPLRGANNDDWGPRFPDTSRMYDPQYQKIARDAAASLGMELREGVYCGLSGPSFETPAEIRMLGILGADAVGMSTVPEAIAACHMGMRLLGLSCVTNLAAGITKEPLTHAEVMAAGREAGRRFSALIREIVPRL